MCYNAELYEFSEGLFEWTPSAWRKVTLVEIPFNYIIDYLTKIQLIKQCT